MIFREIFFFFLKIMKRKSLVGKALKKFSRRDRLPVLRGMFVAPASALRLQQEYVAACCSADDGLVITPGEGRYLCLEQ